MGLLASCGLAGNVTSMDIYGPAGLDDYLQACQRYSQTHFSYPIKVHTVQPGVVFSDSEYSVVCAPLHHRVPAFGYRIIEGDRPGAFDVQKAMQQGVPPGPLYGQLQRGEQVILADGRTLNGPDFCGLPKVGRKIAYCTDTIYCQEAVELSRDADLVIHESTFAHADAELAYQRLHSTSTMAAQVAQTAAAKALFLTHFSPRYAPQSVIGLQDLLLEARAIFPNTELAYDFFKLPGASSLCLVTYPSVNLE